MGSVLVKKSKIKIKNILNENMPRASVEFVIRKDADFDITYFDIDIEGFCRTSVHLWQKNHSTCPPTSELSPAVSSVDSRFDCD